MTEITEGYVLRGERRPGRERRKNGEWMGPEQGDGTARSGPRVNVNLGEIDRSKRNLNTGEKLEVTIERWRRTLRQLTKSRSKEWFGTRDSKCSYMEERRGGFGERTLKDTDRTGCMHGLLETEDKLSKSRCSGIDRRR
jgi:hypothetical protein